MMCNIGDSVTPEIEIYHSSHIDHKRINDAFSLMFRFGSVSVA